MSDQTPAGWLPDPTGRFARRYFDGATWTDHVADAPGETLNDPFKAPAPPAPTWEPSEQQAPAHEAPVQSAPVQQASVQPVNHRDAKAQAKGAKAYAKAQRPWYKKKRFIIPIGILVLAIGGAAAGGGGEDDAGSGSEDSASSSGNNNSGPDSDFTTNEDNPPADDIDGVQCSAEFGIITGVVTVTNNSSETSDYLITIGVEQGGAQVGDGFGSLENVDPGQSGRVEIVATGDTQGQPFSCTIEEVERFAS